MLWAELGLRKSLFPSSWLGRRLLGNAGRAPSLEITPKSNIFCVNAPPQLLNPNPGYPWAAGDWAGTTSHSCVSCGMLGIFSLNLLLSLFPSFGDNVAIKAGKDEGNGETLLVYSLSHLFLLNSANIFIVIFFKVFPTWLILRSHHSNEINTKIPTFPRSSGLATDTLLGNIP